MAVASPIIRGWYSYIRVPRPLKQSILKRLIVQNTNIRNDPPKKNFRDSYATAMTNNYFANFQTTWIFVSKMI